MYHHQNQFYESCILTGLLHSSQIWKTYCHIKTLKKSPSSLSLKDSEHQMAFYNTGHHYSPASQNIQQRDAPQMCWAGDFTRMEDIDLPKRPFFFLFHGELCGKCQRQKPKKCFNDVVKNNFRVLRWRLGADDGEGGNINQYGKAINDGYKTIEE